MIDRILIEKIKSLVKEEFDSPKCKYGPEPFLNHISVMVQYANELSSKLGGDKEIIEIAAWLHDIGSAIDGRENHHTTGAKVAEKLLKDLNFPDDKIQLVKKCILHHRSSVDTKRESIEEKIISEADAVSNFDNVPGIFMAAYLYEGRNQREATEEIVRKLKRKWAMLEFEESRELVQKKYEAVLVLFGEKA